VRILLATYWTIPQPLGGLWPFITLLKKGLEKKGHEVDILGRTIDGSAYMILEKNQSVKIDKLLPLLKDKLDSSTFPQLHLKFFNYEFDRYCMELAASYLNINNYDLIHTQDVISTIAISRIKPKHIPLVASMHGSLPIAITFSMKNFFSSMNQEEIKKTDIYRYYKIIEQLGAKAADCIHTSSRWCRDLLVKDYGISSTSISTFPYGIDIESLEKQPTTNYPISRPENKKVITFSGRLAEIKGLSYLINALHRLKQERLDWVCWIIGQGEMENELTKLVTNLNLQSDVQFLGQRKDVFSLLKQSDIFVLPSLQDNQPFSAIEAQIAGLPSVVSNAGGLPEIVKHGETGLVAPSGKSEPLFNHLKRLLEDDSFCVSLGEKAEIWGRQHWSFDTMIYHTLTMYQKVLNKI
jgi:glycosyltransferase involved in cell wall biosynthesis